ncbi:TPA: CoA-binding protein [Campylobacter jejuni]|nr:CoA-binding protein [Campylobacter jejuni]HDZ5083797.1 CoA-binding protein [Campylobacter jejuni]HDZ5084848.1 CoA-binding protein [Campylobacter jejuni]HDZ5086483.1 CoA-binding protein [Campylobacter jejuni]HDZ5089617.1 CoA-binding protein [Campylobacter jejuni]
MNEKETISYIINTSKNIAIFALSPDKTKASYRVAEFLQSKNYKIFPIYPKEDFILNEKVYRNLDQINDKIDTLILFRKGEIALKLLPKLVEKGIKNLWLQLGINNEKAKEKCKKLGINFIQNRCIMLEYPHFKI